MTATIDLKKPLLKRFLLMLLTLITFILLASIFWLVEEHLRDPHRYPLKVVKIEGEFKYLTKSDIEYAAAEVSRGGWFSVDLKIIRQAVEDIPWVDNASIRRIWPATLELMIIEQKPYARWGDSGLLNLRAESYTPRNGIIPQDLPYLMGPVGSEKQVAKRYLEINKKLAVLDLEIKRIELNQRGAWRLVLNNEIKVELGVKNIDKRLQRLLTSYPLLKSQTNAGILIKIDCRYPNGLAVLRQALTEIS